jgi:hypothetical protein
MRTKRINDKPSTLAYDEIALMILHGLLAAGDFPDQKALDMAFNFADQFLQKLKTRNRADTEAKQRTTGFPGEPSP